MPYVDVAVAGQVTNGALRYTFENPVANTEAIDVLGYSIKRTHSNVHEGNCYLDFKVGSTALSSLRVVQAGYGYDPDNPPRHDNTSSDSPSLGVEFSLGGDIESRGVLDLVARSSRIDVDVLELPHHGSWRPAVAAWVDAIGPRAVFQSTGPERWRRDRWNGTR